MNIAPLLLLNWLVTATFATGFATFGLVLLDLHPLSILTLVLLLFLPDTLYIPELLVSHGSFTYSSLVPYLFIQSRSITLIKYTSS